MEQIALAGMQLICLLIHDLCDAISVACLSDSTLQASLLLSYAPTTTAQCLDNCTSVARLRRKKIAAFRLARLLSAMMRLGRVYQRVHTTWESPNHCNH